MNIRNLHHPKLRVYLFSLVMFKTYFEQFEGIKEQHFRDFLAFLMSGGHLALHLSHLQREKGKDKEVRELWT